MYSEWSKAAAASVIEFIVAISIIDWNSLTTATKSSILNAAAVLDPPISQKRVIKIYGEQLLYSFPWLNVFLRIFQKIISSFSLLRKRNFKNIQKKIRRIFHNKLINFEIFGGPFFIINLSMFSVFVNIL